MSESSLPTFAVKWSGKEFPIEGLSDSTTLADLKQLLMEKTGVRVERQKIMGLKCKGRFKFIAIPHICTTTSSRITAKGTDSKNSVIYVVLQTKNLLKMGKMLQKCLRNGFRLFLKMVI